MKLGHVALDGTKVRANASKHRAMSYGRMKEREEHLAAEVSELLRRAQEVDDDDDRRYGADGRGGELPEELAFREGRLERIREAMAALEPVYNLFRISTMKARRRLSFTVLPESAALLQPGERLHHPSQHHEGVRCVSIPPRLQTSFAPQWQRASRCNPRPPDGPG